MRFKNIGIMILVTCLFIISGCKPAGSSDTPKAKLPISENYFIFDTVVSVRVYDERMNVSHFAEIKKLLEHINETMNRFEENSEVTKINQFAGSSAVQVSKETFYIIKTAKEYAELSGGKFDPTIGPLVDLWAIGNGGVKAPSRAAIEEAMKLVDYKKLLLDESRSSVQLKDSDMTLDLGAIAKGYAADVVADYLQKQGFASAIIDLGGNIVAMGSKPDQSAWSIGIQSPEEKRGAHLGTLPVRNKTIVTSGVYERYFKDNGQVYHHVLDPFTGYPASNELASATIITDNSMNADAMSTAVFVQGLQEGMAFIESTDNAEAIFVTNDHKVYITSGLKNIFKLTSDDYHFAE
ncbi:MULTISPECIES: FAD:protein FMN transferase [unclassified Paenibacillus]|uniref:FAD:protein FMN transferase n=1 Tax=unclassified Paenibacillus TaxID=185978 RepID=UPI002F41EEDA